MGHPTLEKEHEHELHLASALHEFQGGMPREQAEKRALEDYRREHHARAGAHHFSGMKASHAVGDMETAQKHHALYSLHVKALGEDPMGPVPESVRKYQGAGQDKKQRPVYSFKGHDADEFLVQPVSKSELEVIDLKKADTAQARTEMLRAAVNKAISSISIDPSNDLVKYLDDLAKGDVIQFPGRQPPEWEPQGPTCENEECRGGNERFTADVAPGYSLCPSCLNKLRSAQGQSAYDPQEHVKQGFATPQDMHRARIAGVFNPELGGSPFQRPDVRQRMKMPVKGGGELTPPREGHLSLVKKNEDPVKVAAQRLAKTLEVISFAKNLIEQLKAKK
jgi:hypothetical protein